jgi:small subunit ribosomal protein S13
MPRIMGVDIPDKKRLVISLTYLYGIGRTRSEKLIEKLKLDPNMKAHSLTEAEIAMISSFLQTEYLVEGDLRREVQNNIKRLQTIHSYRGLRHRLGLPVRGQRTRSNARTRKGKKKTVAGKKIAAK